MAGTNPENCPFPLGICTPSNMWSLDLPEPSFKMACQLVQPFCTVHCRVFHYFTMGSSFPPKIAPTPLGMVSGPPLTHGTRSHRSHQPKWHLDQFSRFLWVQNNMLYNALPMGKKTPKTAPSHWDFVTPPEEDRATAIGNMHKTFGKDRTCGLGDMLCVVWEICSGTDRQTHTQTCSLQYSATAPVDKVINCYCNTTNTFS